MIWPSREHLFKNLYLQFFRNCIEFDRFLHRIFSEFYSILLPLKALGKIAANFDWFIAMDMDFISSDNQFTSIVYYDEFQRNTIDFKFGRWNLIYFTFPITISAWNFTFPNISKLVFIWICAGRSRLPLVNMLIRCVDVNVERLHGGHRYNLLEHHLFVIIGRHPEEILKRIVDSAITINSTIQTKICCSN